MVVKDEDRKMVKDKKNQRIKVTYKRRIGQNQDCCCHVSQEDDEDYGEELQEQQWNQVNPPSHWIHT